MAQFTTLQLASNITGVSFYSKPSVFNGAENDVLSYSQQLYLKISTSVGSSEIKNTFMCDVFFVLINEPKVSEIKSCCVFCV